MAILRWLKIECYRIWHLVLYVYRRYGADGCRDSAAALTYMTLLAIVPMLTVIYAILSALPAFQEMGGQIQNLIFENFIPSAGQEVKEYLNQFSNQARKLTGIGMAFLVVTAILMLKNIEKSFNKIWHTRKNRSTLWSFLLYWAILSLGTLFIALAMIITTYLVSLNVFFDQVDRIGVTQHLLRYVPYLLTSAAFTLIFVAVPNCKVPLKNGVIGGLLTGLVFEVAKQVFTGIVANTSYQTIYGSFAAIPLFLLWIYLSWLIVLGGAELVNALSGFTTREAHSYSRIVIALAVLELLWKSYRDGSSVHEQYLLRRPWLLGRHSLDSERWTSIRDRLFADGLIRDVGQSEYVLGRDLSHYTLWDLYQLLGYSADRLEVEEGEMPDWLKESVATLQGVNGHNREALSQSLDQLFTQQQDSP